MLVGACSVVGRRPSDRWVCAGRLCGSLPVWSLGRCPWDLLWLVQLVAVRLRRSYCPKPLFKKYQGRSQFERNGGWVGAREVLGSTPVGSVPLVKNNPWCFVNNPTSLLGTGCSNTARCLTLGWTASRHLELCRETAFPLKQHRTHVGTDKNMRSTHPRARALESLKDSGASQRRRRVSGETAATAQARHLPFSSTPKDHGRSKRTKHS